MIEHNIRPEHIIVTTFTKKAANEMKERLSQMLEGTNIQLNKLVIGTFHSICMRILMQYGYVINLKGFKIAADRDWDEVMKSLIDPITDDIADIRDLVSNGSLNGGKPLQLELNKPSEKSPYDIKKLRKQISKLKSKGIYPDDYSLQKDYNKELHIIFKLFQEKLESSGLLDFDDLLVKTSQLLSKRNCVSRIKHVLIDEFQDTNTIQLQLMVKFAMGVPGNCNNITVVGDPDQSIYRFRDAVALNFELMRKKYPGCEIIKLNENYRSTSDVLDFSEAVMRQQNSRTSKNLSSQFSHTFPAVHQSFGSREEEAVNIAQEIKFLKLLPKLFQYSDFAILIRAAYQSRALERALIEKKIPYRIVKGRAFWERKEVEQIVDFLRLVAYDDDKAAFLRTLKSCTSGIGPVTIKKIDAVIDEESKKGFTAISALYKIARGDFKGVGSSKNKDQIQLFLEMVEKARNFVANDNYSPNQLSLLFEFLKSQEPLASLIKEEERAQNIEEVKSQLVGFVPTEVEPINSEDSAPLNEDTFLQSFLSSIQLYSVDDKEEDNEDGVVCISTIHSAKGLEWPVVFIPGLTEGLLPASFAKKDENEEEAIDEERRIFYVSTTRAKQLLYVTNSLECNSWSIEAPEPSRFLTNPVRRLMEDKQLAFKNVENIMKLYDIQGVPYDNGCFDDKVSEVIRLYKLAFVERSMVQQDVHSERYEGFSTVRMYLRDPSFSKIARSLESERISQAGVEIVPLPGPGVKSYAPKVSELDIESSKTDVPVKKAEEESEEETDTDSDDDLPPPVPPSISRFFEEKNDTTSKIIQRKFFSPIDIKVDPKEINPKDLTPKKTLNNKRFLTPVELKVEPKVTATKAAAPNSRSGQRFFAPVEAKVDPKVISPKVVQSSAQSLNRRSFAPVVSPTKVQYMPNTQVSEPVKMKKRKTLGVRRIRMPYN